VPPLKILVALVTGAQDLWTPDCVLESGNIRIVGDKHHSFNLAFFVEYVVCNIMQLH